MCRRYSLVSNGSFDFIPNENENKHAIRFTFGVENYHRDVNHSPVTTISPLKQHEGSNTNFVLVAFTNVEAKS